MSERDPFKARLRRRDVMFGCFVGQPSPALAEMVGYAGFDYVIVDLEHGPTGLETLENMLRAAQAAGAASLVEVTKRLVKNLTQKNGFQRKLRVTLNKRGKKRLKEVPRLPVRIVVTVTDRNGITTTLTAVRTWAR